MFQAIDNLREQEWDKVTTIIRDQTKQFPCDLFNLTIEIDGEVDKDSTKRPRDLNSSDPTDESTPRAKIIRTDKLPDRERVKADALAAAGNFDRELLKEHQCHDPSCRTYNCFCFIDFDNQHLMFHMTIRPSGQKRYRMVFLTSPSEGRQRSYTTNGHLGMVQ